MIKEKKQRKLQQSVARQETTSRRTQVLGDDPMATEALADLHSSLETLFHAGIARQSDRQGTADAIPGWRCPLGRGCICDPCRAAWADGLRVCRSALGSAHDAEDAAQAVFLVLARRARSVRRRDSAASWLYGVARRIAARSRRDEARRRKHERRKAEMAATESRGSTSAEDLEGLYQEIERLPERYRSALVLCYLEGLSHEQAASWLCPVRCVRFRADCSGRRNGFATG